MMNKKTEEIVDNNQEPLFEIHRMPKNYKTGRYGSASKDKVLTSSVLEEKKRQELSSKGKKAGFLIIFFGVILIGALAYFAFLYIKNPEADIFNFSKAPKKDPVQEVVVEEEEERNEEFEFEEEDGIGEEEPWLEDVVVDENEPADEEPESEDFLEIPVANISDSDGDGLSDLEEVVLGTSILSIDSDGDGFDDLTEVLNLYNPIGDGSILDNNKIDKYSNEAFSYSVFYPNSWEVKALSDGSSVVFLISQDSFIQILVEDNETEKDIVDWYFYRFFEIVDDSLILEIDGVEGVFNSDMDSFYLTDGEKVYSFIYNFSPRTPEYASIFRMMINSFKLGK